MMQWVVMHPHRLPDSALSLSCCLRGVSPHGLQFPPTFRYTKRLNMCAWCLAVGWYLIQGVFLSHTHCSWDRLQTHCNPEQDSAVTDKIIKYSEKTALL